jgi:hypothetical protein
MKKGNIKFIDISIENYAISYPAILSLLIKHACVTILLCPSLVVFSKATNLLFAREEL